jgi:hypothetical protein
MFNSQLIFARFQKADFSVKQNYILYVSESIFHFEEPIVFTVWQMICPAAVLSSLTGILVGHYWQVIPTITCQILHYMVHQKLVSTIN